jgi:hypothetical protein
MSTNARFKSTSWYRKISDFILAIFFNSRLPKLVSTIIEANTHISGHRLKPARDYSEYHLALPARRVAA